MPDKPFCAKWFIFFAAGNRRTKYSYIKVLIERTMTITISLQYYKEKGCFRSSGRRFKIRFGIDLF